MPSLPRWPFVLFLVGALASGCRSTSTNVTGPSSTKCAVTLSGSGLTVPGGGGSGAVNVSVNRECSWSATSEAAWVSITSGASGQGPGTIAFSAQANPAASARQAGIAVGAQRVVIQQEAAACTFSVTPVTATVAAGGDTLRFSVAAASGCAWTAQASVPWATIGAGASGSGAGEVVVQVSANTGAPRSTTLTVAGIAVNVSQGGAACSYGVSLSASAFGVQGGTATATVTTAAGCAWSASSSQSWVVVEGQGSGSGNGAVTFSVAGNTGPARTATLTVAGQAFTISQASAQTACTFAVSPGSRAVGSDGGTGTFSVTTAAACEWTATSNVSWLSISGGARTTGSGTVTFTAAANAGGARSGTLTVAGETVRVDQAAGACAYAVAPSVVSSPAAGGPVTITVTTTAGCAWTATTAAPWLTIAAGSSGSGSGTVSVTVAANGGPAREAAVSVAGQAVTIRQDGLSCSYTVAPTALQAPGAGGTFDVDVTTTAACPWTATSNAPWLAIASGSGGTGSGRVRVTALPNTDVQPRNGTVTVAGQAVTVAQAGATCAYTLAPIAQTVAAAGAAVSLSVTTAAGCAWAATSNVPWITFTSGTSGSGSGTISLAVAANTSGAARSGTVTVAGQTATINQQ